VDFSESWLAVARVGVEVFGVLALGVVFAVKSVVGAWDRVVACWAGVEGVTGAGVAQKIGTILTENRKI
jgi:hypothetical protein